METLKQHNEDLRRYKSTKHYIIKCDFCHTELFCDDADFTNCMTEEDIISCKCCNCGHIIKLTKKELHDYQVPNENDKNI